MTSILLWIKANPQTVKSVLVGILAWVGKIIFAATGKTASLGAWGDALNQGVDVLVWVITAYSAGSAAVHISRGPALTDVDQAATIVAALKAPPILPVSEVLTEVKTVAEAVAAVDPSPLESPPLPTKPVSKKRKL